MILGANHVGMSVPDMDKALAFYCDLLGFEKLTELSWPTGSSDFDRILNVEDTSCRVVHVGMANLMIELFEFHESGNCAPKAQDPGRPVVDHGITHLALAVTDIHAEHTRLSAAGMDFHSDPVQVGPNLWSVYGRDPFGNVVELEDSKGRTVPNELADVG